MRTNEERADRSQIRRLLDQSRGLVLGSFVFANLAFPLFLYLVSFPEPWRGFAGERSPITWFSSVQCFLIAALLLAVFVVSRLGRNLGTDAAPRSWPWIVFSVGFLFMGVDEKLMIHEAVRETVLKPQRILTGIPWLMPGDVVLLFYVLVGAALSLLLLAELRRARGGLPLFVAAILLIALIAVQDALRLDFLRSSSFRPFRTIGEEVGEVWSQLLFACSFTLVLFRKLERLLRGFVA